MTGLGTLGGTHSEAYGINDSGQVVGYSGMSGGAVHAFLYTGGGIIDLNDLLPSGSGWTLVEARGISDSGQIVGHGLHNGETRAFLLTPQQANPIPEPSTLAMLAGLVGAGVAGCVQRRRKG